MNPFSVDFNYRDKVSRRLSPNGQERKFSAAARDNLAVLESPTRHSLWQFGEEDIQ
jgi:hypothetical protein